MLKQTRKERHIVIFFSIAMLYSLFLSKTLFIMIVSYSVFAIMGSLLAATIPAVIVPQAFKTCRVSTIGISTGFSVVLGSFIPLSNEIIKKLTNNQLSPAFIIMGCAVVSFTMLFYLETEEIK